MARKTRLGLGSTDPREAALALVRAWGSEGGKLRWKGVTPEQRSEIARKAARSRWSKSKAKAKPK